MSSYNLVIDYKCLEKLITFIVYPEDAGSRSGKKMVTTNKIVIIQKITIPIENV
jgi:hypothetical protein